MTSVDRIQGLSGSLAVKAPCRVASQGNLTLSGLQTIDGVTLVEGDRVLVWQQTNGVENGIYTASTGTWLRALDFNGRNDVVTGTQFLIAAGTQAGATFRITTTGTITPGTTSIAITQLTQTLRTEQQVATEGQTVVTINDWTYPMGGVALEVYVNGLRQEYGDAYTETSNSSITFTGALSAGDQLLFTSGSLVGVAGDAPQLRADLLAPTGSGLVGWKQSGTGATPRNVQAKLRESVSVLDFGAVGDGITDDTAAIQAAHAAAVAAGFKDVEFIAGTYSITALTWSPHVKIKCVGSVVLRSSIASGKCLSVSTQYGNWPVVQQQLDRTRNSLVSGKLYIENALGAGANTAIGIFFGEDGVTGAYSCREVLLSNVGLIGWSKSHTFGSQAYMITFSSCDFYHNVNDIYVTTGYVDNLEKLQYIDCVFGEFTNCINGDAGYYGDFYFSGCSIDYGTRAIANVANTAIINMVNCHYEWNGTEIFIYVNGAVNLVNPYFVKVSGANATPLVASIVGTLKVLSPTYNTPTGVTLYNVVNPSGQFVGETDRKQFGGLEAIYCSNSGGGRVSTLVAIDDFIGTPSLGAESSITLPNGLIFKTGTIANTAIGINATVNTAVVFPTAFPTNCLYANATAQPDGSADFYGVTQIVTPGTTGFTVAVRNGAIAQNFVNNRWFAIGY